MRKHDFAALLLGVVSLVLFALGMCMAMLPQWGMFRPGVVLGCVGLVLGLLTYFAWRRLAGKAPIRVSGRTLGISLVGIVGALALGCGMCLTMVWNHMAPGVALGLVGILILLSLIPMVKGWKVSL